MRKKNFFPYLCFFGSILSCNTNLALNQHHDDEKFGGIEEIEIHNDDGSVVVRSSENDETTVESSTNKFDVVQNGGKLTIRSRKQSYLFGFLSFSNRVDFTINVSPSVRFLSLSSADCFFDIANCSFQKICLNAADIRFKMKNFISDIVFNGANASGSLEDVVGNIDFNVCDCNVDYALREKPAFSVNIKFYSTA